MMECLDLFASTAVLLSLFYIFELFCVMILLCCPITFHIIYNFFKSSSFAVCL